MVAQNKRMILLLGAGGLMLLAVFLSLNIVRAQNIEQGKITFDRSLNLLDDRSVKYYSYKGVFEPLKEFIDIEVIDIDLNNKALKIEPAMPEKLDTVENTARKHGALAAINAGFFDVTNGMSVSYVVIDGKIVGNPQSCKNLTSNPAIKPFLKNIYNRAELKILDCSGKTTYKIDYRNASQKSCRVTSALQGGPLLLPAMDLDKESFLVLREGKKVREAANVSNKDARVAVGLTPDNHMVWLLVKAGYKDSKYYGLTIEQLATLFKYLNVESALAYDGGSSTTLYVLMPDQKPQVTIADVNVNGERYPARVKSVLLLLKEDE